MPTTKARARIRVPVPRLDLLLGMGAGEAGGVRCGLWGLQAAGFILEFASTEH
jgi:hypothetical protein